MGPKVAPKKKSSTKAKPSNEKANTPKKQSQPNSGQSSKRVSNASASSSKKSSTASNPSNKKLSTSSKTSNKSTGSTASKKKPSSPPPRQSGAGAGGEQIKKTPASAGTPKKVAKRKPTKKPVKSASKSNKSRTSAGLSSFSSKIPEKDPFEGCPPGLEDLLEMDFIGIHHSIEPLEVMVNKKFNYHYNILDLKGQRLYVSGEKSGCCACLCGRGKAFVVTVADEEGKIVLKVKRSCSCSLCCWGGKCGDKAEIYDRNNELIGKVKQRFNKWTPLYELFDHESAHLFTIKGPPNLHFCRRFKDTRHAYFIIYNSVKREIGTVRKFWSGYLKEFFTAAEIFGISFPIDTEIRSKALLFGAAIILHIQYYHTSLHLEYGHHGVTKGGTYKGCSGCALLCCCFCC